MAQDRGTRLEDFLFEWRENILERQAICDTILRLCEGAKNLSNIIKTGIPKDVTVNAGQPANACGDLQKPLDVVAHNEYIRCLEGTAVQVVASEEAQDVISLDPNGTLALAIDPLDGSSNIENNLTIGSIFSILPVNLSEPSESFFQAGIHILAAGVFVFGPSTEFILTLGDRTHLFYLDPNNNQFSLKYASIIIPQRAKTFAINMSNYRHWDTPVRQLIDEYVEGEEGDRQQDYNMRWLASLVAETRRILNEGGVFLYPADLREGYHLGRLRLLYEAAPIAKIITQAGGHASNGVLPILDLVPQSLHQKVPLFFGSNKEMICVEHSLSQADGLVGASPLFGKRNLFR